MLRRRLTLGGGLALTLAALLLCTGPAAAQRFGRGGWGGYGWNNYGYGGGWNNYGWGGAYNPYWGGYPGGWYGYNTYSYASPQNFTYGNYYHPYSGNYWDYSYSAPYYSGYYNPGTAPVYSGDVGPGYFGQYAATGRNTGYEGAYESSDENLNNPNAVSINIRVPADAKVWFDGQSTRQQGTFRQFVSPPIQQGKDYTYDIKAQWNDNGKTVTKTKTVTVHAGERLTLDMLKGENGTVTVNSGANQRDNAHRANTDRNATDRTGRDLDANRDAINERNRNTTAPLPGTSPSRVPNNNVPPTGNRTNPNDQSNAPGANGASPNINRTNPNSNTGANPTTGATGTNPTGLNPATGTPATSPTSPSTNRTTAPGTGSDTTRGTNNPGTGGTNNPNKSGSPDK